jgi:hypothetical protein
MFKSNVCRLTGAELARICEMVQLKPGRNPIPAEVIAPRQVRLLTGAMSVRNVELRLHRGSYIPIICRRIATSLVGEGGATWEPQSLLCYVGKDYKADPNVIDSGEDVSTLGDDELVAVAMIGNGRSPLAVCRNIVSGCQKPEKLVDDAKDAMEAANVFLVED